MLQCDLHTTTNILATELADKCTTRFSPVDGETAATAQCCTSDLTLAEFKTLKGKMDAANPQATTAAEYMDGTASWRTDLYSAGSHGKLMTHAESVELIQMWGRKATPELKTYTPGDGMPTYDEIRQKLVDEYKAVDFPASDVWLQSFNLPDVEYWIANEADFGVQAVYLDGSDACLGTAATCTAETDFMVVGFDNIKAMGVNFIAPPMQMLVAVEANKYVPSEYAVAAKAAGLKIITWTLERSGPLGEGGGWYYGSSNAFTDNDGDMFELLHVLHHDVGIEGIFSDWPATTTFYANCIIDKQVCQKYDGPAVWEEIPYPVGDEKEYVRTSPSVKISSIGHVDIAYNWLYRTTQKFEGEC